MNRRNVLTYMSVRFSILATEPCPICSVWAISSWDSFRARRTSPRSICSPRRTASVSAATWASGVIRARNVANECLPAIVLLLLQLSQMLVVEIVGPRDHPIVKALVAGLVAADQQDRHAARIERIEDP